MIDMEGYERVENVVLIPIDELVVDECNIRGGVWDYDDDLVRSVSGKGVQMPLVVRPLNSGQGGAKWGIVAGSRRFNAAIDAGVDEIPCRVMELDDEEAMLHSMEENRNRRPTAKWRDIEFIGEVAERFISKGLSRNAAFGKIERQIGMSRPTIDKYHLLYQLHLMVKSLLREPEDRTRAQREFLRLIFPSTHIDPIDLGTAKLVAAGLADRRPSELARIAVALDSYPSSYREDIVKRLVQSPGMNVDEAAGESIRRTGETRSVYFPQEVLDALVMACIDRQTRFTELVKAIVSKWLREQEYIESL